jgi:hypothetical protein
VTIATLSQSSATRAAGVGEDLVDVDGDGDGGDGEVHRGQRTMLTAPYGASVQGSSVIHFPTSFRSGPSRRTFTS